MFNFLGKTFVILHTAASLLFLGVTAALFLLSPDLGMKKPREKVTESVPSLIDVRIAAVAAVAEMKFDALERLQRARKALRNRERDRAANYIWYVQELQRLESSPKDTITIQRIAKLPAPDSKRRIYKTSPTGRPLLEVDPATGRPKLVTYTFPEIQVGGKLIKPARTVLVNKSLAKYQQIYKQYELETIKYLKERNQWIDKQNFVLKQRRGVPDPTDPTKLLRPGITELFTTEIENQERLRAEKRDVEPLWVREIYEAQKLLERQQQLEARKKELKAALAAK